MCDELYAYTLAHEGGEFLHQHAVDAYAAQHVGVESKPIYQAAALIGLYLFCERGYAGRHVQRAHMALGNKMKNWPLFAASGELATLTVMNPLGVEAGSERDEAIRQWARAAWAMWHERHAEVEQRLMEMREEKRA